MSFESRTPLRKPIISVDFTDAIVHVLVFSLLASCGFVRRNKLPEEHVVSVFNVEMCKIT
jgi:hypothetical protein